MDQQHEPEPDRPRTARKPYVKGRIEKHRAAAIVSGSGNDGCLYTSRTIGATYYH